MFAKKSTASVVIITIALGVSIFAATSSAIAPIAARLIGGSTTVVNIQNFPGGVKGITTDGSKVYLHSSDHGIGRIYETNFDGTGTLYHNITNPPQDVTFEQSNIAMSHGCIWTSSHSGNLYCISQSTWTANQVAVPNGKPLPSGSWWMYSNMTDLPDGRIGRISAPYSYNGAYASTFRVYTVTGTGNSATVAWSEDFILKDTDAWPGDDHGIATDGVYLYRIQCCSSNYRVWALTRGADSTVVHDEVVNVDDGLSNATYIAHDHVRSRYIVGDYDGGRFYYTAAQNPGAGPGVPTTTTTTTTTTTVAPTTTVRTTTTTLPAALEIVLAAPGTTVPVGQASIATVASTGAAKATAPAVSTSSTSSTVPRIATTTVPNIAPAAPGQAVVAINGSTAPSSVTRDNNQVVITSGSMKATIGSLDNKGNTGALDNDGNVVLKPGDRVRLRVSGLLPNSKVEAWIFSDPHRLGTATVDATGSVLTNFVIPKDTPSGSHRIALVTRLVEDKEATFTLGIRVGSFKKPLRVPAWLIALPLVLAIGFAMFLPPALRKRKRLA